jgi:hypothetical protein
MATKEQISDYLNRLVNTFIGKNALQSELQALLSTRNKFEKADDEDVLDSYDFSFYFTNGKEDSTFNFCDLRIDYLKTRSKKVIYITSFEILYYYN